MKNHDYDSLKSTGQNLALALSSRRHDLVTVGYGPGIINIKNDQIIMRHTSTPNKEGNNIFNNKIYKCSETNFNVGRGKDTLSKIVNNEEDRGKILTLNNTRLSQTEKFNRRYNKS